MKEFEKLKAEYDATPIPQELNDRIHAGIRQGRRRRVLRLCHRSLGTAAACLVVAVGILNVSPPVAAAAADLPVLGHLFQVLTVRAYDQSEGGIDYHVSVPGVISDSSSILVLKLSRYRETSNFPSAVRYALLTKRVVSL